MAGRKSVEMSIAPGAEWLGDAGCALCAVVRASGEWSGTEAIVVAHLDESVVAFLRSDLPGLLLAPFEHVDTLSALPGQGELLAMLRGAVLGVQSLYGTSGAMVEPTTVLSGAVGHVSYHVVPTGYEGHPPLPRDLPAEARYFAERLQSRYRLPGEVARSV